MAQHFWLRIAPSEAEGAALDVIEGLSLLQLARRWLRNQRYKTCAFQSRALVKNWIVPVFGLVASGGIEYLLEKSSPLLEGYQTEHRQSWVRMRLMHVACVFCNEQATYYDLHNSRF